MYVCINVAAQNDNNCNAGMRCAVGTSYGMRLRSDGMRLRSHGMRLRLRTCLQRSNHRMILRKRQKA